MWRRLHKLPKRFWRHCSDIYELNPRAKYIKKQSLARYDETEDGKYFAEVSRNLKPEIGRVEGVRFIIT